MKAAFERREGRLFADGVPLDEIAERCGTPTYVYARCHFEAQYRALEQALTSLDHLVCYAVKANGNLAVLDAFARLGAGFDIVSGGELERVIRAGGDPARVVFSGVGKRDEEMDFALKHEILCFNVESASELDALERRARLLHRKARISIRVNPDIDAGTHPYIATGLDKNKFGVPIEEARELYVRAARSSWLEPTGVDCHLGSQVTELAPFTDALDALLGLADQLRHLDIPVRHVDLGGGLPVRYGSEAEFDLGAYAAAIVERVRGTGMRVLIEPGRFLVANGGVLLTRVLYLKPSFRPGRPNFAIIDAAMNDLIRPPLYQAWHEVERVLSPAATSSPLRWDLVGPVCESADFMGLDRELALAEGDLLAIRSAGAYGMVQSSNYNARNRPAEVLVVGNDFSVVRRRETVSEQLALERIPR